MSEQKLSERMNAEIKELILRGLPVTQSQALDWRDEVAALEAKLEAMERVVLAVKDYAHNGPSGELWDVVMRALAAHQEGR